MRTLFCSARDLKSTPRAGMATSTYQPRRPQPDTYFFRAAPNEATNAPAAGTSVARSQLSPEKREGQIATARSKGDRSDPASTGDQRTRSSNVRIFHEDLWADYEKGIEILPKRRTCLCQHRRNKKDLVHIQ